MAEEAETRESILKRGKNYMVSEWKQFANCVGSASPDRSSASVLFLVMFATSLTVTFSRYLMASQPGRFPNYVVSWLIISFEVASILSLVLMWCYASNRASERVADGDLQPWHRFIRRNIKLFGIVPFYFTIFIFDVVRLIADLTCIDAWVACLSSVILVEHVTDLLYPIARTFYLCIELIICVKFNAKDFCQNTLVLFGLAIVQATNLSCWLDALVDESHVFASDRNWTYQISRCFDETIVNVSDHYVQCFSRTTGEYGVLKSASPYLYPFIMEYLMLVIECVADWFFSDAARHDPTPPSNVQPQPVQSVGPIPLEHARAQSPASSIAIDGNGGTQLVRPTSYGSIHVERQLQQTATADAVNISRASSANSVLSEADGTHQDETLPLIATGSHVSTDVSPSFEHVGLDAGINGGRPMWYDRCPRLFFSGILPSIASFLLLIFGVYNFCLGQTGYRNVFICYRSGYWIALMLAPLVGYTACRRFPSGPMNPNGFEYFMILSCIGPILQSVFTIVANVSTHGLVVPMGMFLTEEVTNILQICTQIMFYAYAKSVQIQANDPEFNRKRSILMGVISYFAVCNAAIWVEDSFIETRSSATSWQRLYFDNWPLIYNTFNPLSLMFRFNSCLLFLDVYFDKRRRA